MPNPVLETHAREMALVARQLDHAITELTRRALLHYGDHGPLVSGIVRAHFPNAVKHRLRKLHALRNEAWDESMHSWRSSGRRTENLSHYRGGDRLARIAGVLRHFSSPDVGLHVGRLTPTVESTNVSRVRQYRTVSRSSQWLICETVQGSRR